MSPPPSGSVKYPSYSKEEEQAIRRHVWKYTGSIYEASCELLKHGLMFGLGLYLLPMFCTTIVGICFYTFIGTMFFNRTFMIMHDCAHNSFTPSKKFSTLGPCSKFFLGNNTFITMKSDGKDTNGILCVCVLFYR